MLHELEAYVIAQSVLVAWAFTALVACELIAPRERHSLGSRLRGALYWTIYLPLAGAIVSGFSALRRAMGLKPLLELNLTPSSSLPAWAQVCLGIVGALAVALFIDFLYYWCHRAQHRWFWRFHAIHHSIRELNAVNSYHHWSEELIRVPFMAAPMALVFNIQIAQADALAATLALQTWWIHSPLSVNVGPLGRLLNNNHLHRIHHSMEPRHFDRNFGGFSILWDQLFGTAYFPEQSEWPRTGVAETLEPATVVEFLFRPFQLGDYKPNARRGSLSSVGPAPQE